MKNQELSTKKFNSMGDCKEKWANLFVLVPIHHFKHFLISP